MAETSLPWDGTATGDATLSPLDAATEFALLMRLVSAAGLTSNSGGVAAGEDNELVVSGTSSPVSVASGKAMVYGTGYTNSAAVSVVVATPGGATRIDRIVLRKSWSAQTVRITRIAGAEGGAAPAMTQSAGTTWDIPLALVSITTGGVITVTDAREYVVANAMTVVKVKTADEIVNNSAALQNDDALFFAVGANETWQIDISLTVEIQATSDFRFALTLPAGATVACDVIISGAGTTPVSGRLVASGTAIFAFNAGGPAAIRITGWVTNGATPGLCNFQWAQETAAVNNTTVYSGGSLVAHKL